MTLIDKGLCVFLMNHQQLCCQYDAFHEENNTPDTFGGQQPENRALLPAIQLHEADVAHSNTKVMESCEVMWNEQG